jgi:hypothetical protein
VQKFLALFGHLNKAYMWVVLGVRKSLRQREKQTFLTDQET